MWDSVCVAAAKTKTVFGKSKEKAVYMQQGLTVCWYVIYGPTQQSCFCSEGGKRGENDPPPPACSNVPV